METIGKSKLWSFMHEHDEAIEVTCSQVRGDEGHFVTSYMDLAKKIAELQFRNRDHVLLFRGQNTDYKNTEGETTLKPSLFRPVRDRIPGQDRLQRRFNTLAEAERLLAREYELSGLLGEDRVRRHRLVRWTILQHYEVCKTPLLDVTHSLRIAASFASKEPNGDAYVYVLGIPYLSGGITASAEAGIQAIRLSSFCPPSAVRAHIQEGYLLGEYPEMTGFDQKQHYFHYEIDFGRRLIAKFRFDPSAFWNLTTFPEISSHELYPSRQVDPLKMLTIGIRNELAEPEI